MTKYEVGQTVVVTDVNYRGPVKHATVTKVGTKLVYIDKDVYGRENSPYRISDGTRNDNYRHSSIHTLEEYAEKIERAELISALREEGVIFDRKAQAVSVSRLRAIMEVFK